MTIPEDFKTRLKIAKSKIKKQFDDEREKRGSFMGNAFKLGTAFAQGRRGCERV